MRGGEGKGCGWDGYKMAIQDTTIVLVVGTVPYFYCDHDTGTYTGDKIL